MIDREQAIQAFVGILFRASDWTNEQARAMAIEAFDRFVALPDPEHLEALRELELDVRGRPATGDLSRDGGLPRPEDQAGGFALLEVRHERLREAARDMLIAEAGDGYPRIRSESRLRIAAAALRAALKEET